MHNTEIDKVQVIRYFRPEDENSYTASNLGGITFVFDLDYVKRTVDVKFSICSLKENFNKKVGTSIACQQNPSKTFDLDGFIKLADRKVGFVPAYLSMIDIDQSFNKNDTRERKLLEVISKYGNNNYFW